MHSKFRGGVGQLQLLQSQENPLLLCCLLPLESYKSKTATPNGHDLLSLNKLTREAKSMRISVGGLCQGHHRSSGFRPRTLPGRTALMDHPRVAM